MLLEQETRIASELSKSEQAVDMEMRLMLMLIRFSAHHRGSKLKVNNYLFFTAYFSRNSSASNTSVSAKWKSSRS